MSARRAPESTGSSAAFSQRELGRNGLLLKNSSFTDDLRRSVTKRLPHGAPERMASLLGVRVDTIYDQNGAECRYTLDAFVTGLLQLSRHEARHVLRKIARKFDALVIEDPSIDDSGVGL
jgi:hypothetical protein